MSRHWLYCVVRRGEVCVYFSAVLSRRSCSRIAHALPFFFWLLRFLCGMSGVQKRDLRRGVRRGVAPRIIWRREAEPRLGVVAARRSRDDNHRGSAPKFSSSSAQRMERERELLHATRSHVCLRHAANAVTNVLCGHRALVDHTVESTLFPVRELTQRRRARENTLFSVHSFQGTYSSLETHKDPVGAQKDISCIYLLSTDEPTATCV